MNHLNWPYTQDPPWITPFSVFFTPHLNGLYHYRGATCWPLMKGLGWWDVGSILCTPVYPNKMKTSPGPISNWGIFYAHHVHWITTRSVATLTCMLPSYAEVDGYSFLWKSELGERRKWKLQFLVPDSRRLMPLIYHQVLHNIIDWSCMKCRASLSINIRRIGSALTNFGMQFKGCSVS